MNIETCRGRGGEREEERKGGREGGREREGGSEESVEGREGRV